MAAQVGRRVSRFFSARPKARLLSLLTVPAIWIVVLYVGSLAALLVTSLHHLNEDGTGIVKTFGGSNYHDVVASSVNRAIIVRTVEIAALVTIVDMVLALPIAFFIVKMATPRARNILTTMVLVPLWGSYVIKTFAWRAIIGSPGGVLDKTVGWSPGYGYTALVIVLAYLWLPFMIVPICAGLDRLPSSLLEASNDLGAKFWMGFRRIVLPLLLPAIVAGSVFTFSLSLGDYIATGFVGGANQMIGTVVYSNITADRPFAAAFGAVPVVIMVVYLLGIRRSGALENL